MEKKIKNPAMKDWNKYLASPVSVLLLVGSLVNAQSIEITKDDKVDYQLGISFNQEAIDNNAFLVFKVTYDQRALDISFSQGDFARNLLKIEAEKFKPIDKDGNEGLIMSIKSATKKPIAGTYNVSLKLIDRSSDLEVENGSLDLVIDNINLLAEEPMELWKILAIFGILITFISISFIIIITSKRKFPKGIIQIIEAGSSVEVPLKGKNKLSLSDYLVDFPFEFILGKKPFGYYQGPVIKVLKGEYDASKSTGEAITKGSVIYSEETVKIIYSEKTILVNYNH